MANKKSKGRSVNGILLLDKPLGISSNRALQISKKLFQAQKAGHTGSLDPLASGMLPICFGESTKISAYLLDSDKQYITDAYLGIKTTTGDKEGEIVSRCALAPIDEGVLCQTLAQYTGKIRQIPPMYSALKKDGKPLYKLARKGLVVERDARQITVYKLSVVFWKPPILSLRIRCSKGTYIRTLVEDIGESLGCGAYVHRLHREFVEPFSGQKSWQIDELKQLDSIDKLNTVQQLLLPPDSVLGAFPTVLLNQSQQEYFMCGRSITADFSVPALQLLRTYGPGGQFLGVSEYSENRELKAKRVFNLDS